MWTLENEMQLEWCDMCIKHLEIEKTRIIRRGRLSEEEDQRLDEIEIELQIYEGLIHKLYRSK